MASQGGDLTLENATNWARSNQEWDKVYQYLADHPQDFFVIFKDRRWPIAHQVVYHGNCERLKRILELLIDQVDIQTKSVDNKVLRDVALERKKKHPDMCEYVERLFLQDQLIRDARQSNWHAMISLLNANPGLANEKPPHSSSFPIHFVVQNGNCDILRDLVDRYQCDINVKNKTGETPLDIAIRLKKFDMCQLLQSKESTEPISTTDQTKTSTAAIPKEPEVLTIPPVTSAPQSNEQTSSPCTTTVSNGTTSDQQTASNSVTSEQKPNGQDANNHLINSLHTNESTEESPALFNPDFQRINSSPSSRRGLYSPIVSPQPLSHMIMTKSLISAHSTSSSYCSEPCSPTSVMVSSPLSPTQSTQSSPSTLTTTTTSSSSSSSTSTITTAASSSPPPSTETASPRLIKEELIKLLSCPLCRQILDDPVSAADGVTYERSAIVGWLDKRHTSPTTNLPMKPTLVDNVEMKTLIESIKKLRRP